MFYREDLKDNHIEHHDEMIYKCLDPCTSMFKDRAYFYQHLVHIHNTKITRENEHLYMIKPQRKPRGKRLMKSRNTAGAGAPSHRSAQDTNESTTETHAVRCLASNVTEPPYPEVSSLGTDQPKSKQDRIEINNEAPRSDTENGNQKKRKHVEKGSTVDNLKAIYHGVTVTTVAEVHRESPASDKPDYLNALRKGIETYRIETFTNTIRMTGEDGADSRNSTIPFCLPLHSFPVAHVDLDHSYSAESKGQNLNRSHTRDHEDTEYYSESDVDEISNATNDENADGEDQDELEHVRANDDDRNEFLDANFSMELPDEENDDELRNQFDEPCDEEMAEMNADDLDDGIRILKQSVGMDKTGEAEVGEGLSTPELGILGVNNRAEGSFSDLGNITANDSADGIFKPHNDWESNSEEDENGEDVLHLRLTESENTDSEAKPEVQKSVATPLGAKEVATTSSSSEPLSEDIETVAPEVASKTPNSESRTEVQKLVGTTSEPGNEANTVARVSSSISLSMTAKNIAAATSSTTPVPAATAVTTASTEITSQPSQNSEGSSVHQEKRWRVCPESNLNLVKTENADEKCCVVALEDAFENLSREGICVAKQEVLRVLCNVEFNRTTPSMQMFNVRPLIEAGDEDVRRNTIHEGKNIISLRIGILQKREVPFFIQHEIITSVTMVTRCTIRVIS